MYKKVSTDMNFATREEQILSYWEENEIFKKTMEERDDAPIFTFYEGPPTANGEPHLGHVITRAVKDLFPRYKYMKGYNVLRKAGWDTHGLPVELEVEKDLGIEGKAEIEEYGVEKFIERCKESVWKYEKPWRDMSERVGYWADMDDPYITYENEYIESVWWALKTIWDKDLLYKGHKIVPYCPRCGTALSSHEVAQGYEDIVEDSIYAKFKLKDKDNEYFVAWTTTPWTLPSNTALCMNPNENYARVKYNGEVLIMAEALVEDVLKEDYEILDVQKGTDFEHTKYEPLFSYMEDEGMDIDGGFYIVVDDYVTLSDGTGVVHQAPAFGEDDYRVSRKYDLPFVQYVDEEGRFPEEVKEFSGMFVKDADPEIIKQLESENKVLYVEEVEHSYPHCWRCETPLLYFARESWFVAMEQVRDDLLANNEEVNWLPENIKHGRFGKWLENVVDWGISRERYWGTPLPVWECTECDHHHTVGSIEEMVEMGQDVDPDIELHKPYIDDVVLTCPECQADMKRVEEVIDCWFDSGCMPFAQWHYPFENKDIFEKHFPADFISEAVDQTRGWFYSLIAISTVLFDEPAYKNVIVLGHVLDAEGQKMSKSRGNAISPQDAIDKQGADAIRWYFYVGSNPWLPSRFSEEAVAEGQRKFMGTLWNTYAFYILYANIDKFDPTEHELDIDNLNLMDRWILSRLHSTIKEVDTYLDDYKVTESARVLNDFVDELSNWYVRRSRERFWASGMEEDKVNAYMTLYTVLEQTTRLIAPFVPFMSESMYQNLVLSVDENAKESVHLTSYPVFDENQINTKLEEQMDETRTIVMAGRAGRNTANIKNRQPLAHMYVRTDTELLEDYLSIVEEELNIKEVTFTDDVGEFANYDYKPQLRTLGPKYGKDLPTISAYLEAQQGNELMQQLQEGTVEITHDGVEFELELDDVLTEVVQTGRFVFEKENNTTIVLDTDLNEALIEEGFVREIISKIQSMRRDVDFDVMDTIHVGYKTTEKLEKVILDNMDWIKEEVLAETISTELSGTEETWDINGEEAILSVDDK